MPRLADLPLYLQEDELHSLNQRTPPRPPAEATQHLDDGYEPSRREVVERLRLVNGVSQVVVDQSEVLAVKRPGFDLAVFESQSFRCRAADLAVAHVGLVLKRITCVDRRMYDIKVYELDTFMRFMNHPCVIPLFAMWSEPVAQPYAYRTLVGLYQEGSRGSLLEYAVHRSDGRRLRNRRIKLLACNIASALRAFHNCSVIHAGVRPQNIYVSENRVALIGESRKVELDSLRYSHHLFSKLFIASAMDRKVSIRAYTGPTGIVSAHHH